MLLSYVFQKTGRLTFEEKCKLLEFTGMIVRETVFPPLPALCKSGTGCIDLSTHQEENTSSNVLIYVEDLPRLKSPRVGSSRLKSGIYLTFAITIKHKTFLKTN